LNFSCIERLSWLSIILQVVEYLSGSPESSCPKSITSVNTSLKELSAVTTCTAVFLKDTYISLIEISLESLNKAIFAISSWFAYSRVLLYFVFSWSYFSLTVANLKIKSLSNISIQIEIV
jgi:hypothetical protein